MKNFHVVKQQENVELAPLVDAPRPSGPWQGFPSSASFTSPNNARALSRNWQAKTPGPRTQHAIKRNKEEAGMLGLAYSTGPRLGPPREASTAFGHHTSPDSSGPYQLRHQGQHLPSFDHRASPSHIVQTRHVHSSSGNFRVVKYAAANGIKAVRRDDRSRTGSVPRGLMNGPAGFPGADAPPRRTRLLKAAGSPGFGQALHQKSFDIELNMEQFMREGRQTAMSGTSQRQLTLQGNQSGAFIVGIPEPRPFTRGVAPTHELSDVNVIVPGGHPLAASNPDMPKTRPQPANRGAPQA